MKKTTVIMDAFNFYGEEDEDHSIQDESGVVNDEVFDEETAYGLFEDEDPEELMEFLNQYDYNLNSPIILEHTIELWKYLNNLPYKEIFQRPEWKTIGQLHRKKRIKMTPGEPSESELHRMICGEILRSNIPKGEFFNLLTTVIENSNETLVVLKAFLKGWLGTNTLKDYKDIRDIDVSPEFWSWGEIFWDVHKMVILLNSTGRKESDRLQNVYPYKRIMLDGEMVGKEYISKIFGSIGLIGGYVFFQKWGLIGDRNLLLMIKDITVSRTQTILSMLYHHEQIFTQNHIESLINLYRLGDEHIGLIGNLGYDGIKLLEPMCNAKLCRMAQSYRPHIPLFKAFEEHIGKSINEKDYGTGRIKKMNELVDESETVDLCLCYYSVFRHWGHPSIEYMEGLQKLEEQVNMKKNIDDDYAQQLGSDLAFKIIKKYYFDKKKWPVDPTRLDDKHLLKKHIIFNTWPNQHTIQEFGDKWHTLDIVKIYDIPDLLDPSIIYSDKSHSMDRDEVIEHIRKKPNRPIPTKRVLTTLLSKPATNWETFLTKVNNIGLPKSSLVIGLKGKEREIKRIGRFFSLLSWELREYFVVTEYLIKEYFVPLFKGLTMADDLQSVTKKLLENSNGQGLNDYSVISIANHIDYEKWNNHQRYESNQYVFRVMGQCFGLPNLFTRTHEFFQESFIYYTGRPDLMIPIGNSAESVPGYKVCWEGQSGGLEGLRQKGWSVLNLLVIERESKIRNTLVKVLAQGDNQTISTMYKTPFCQTDNDLKVQIGQIIKNNQAIMDAIRRGAERLGLIINEDETMQSADYLNYGKIPIFRGSIRGLDCKRWSRVNCTTNDQVPNIGNTMATVSTNALTVSHYSTSPLNAMYLHNLFGNYALFFLGQWNPAIRADPKSIVKNPSLMDTREYRIANLYLDPSLGGIGGTSFTRFLIRMFPDPVTESLAFWKVVYRNTDDEKLKQLIISFGNPITNNYEPNHLAKLIEAPESLNLKRGISASNLLKEEVKKNLINNVSRIENQIIRSAVEYIKSEEQGLLAWLGSIKPVFPRFLSEMLSSTYYGITVSMIGLIQNSKTIRNQFRKKYSSKIDDVVVKSELSGIASILHHIMNKDQTHPIWDCSSTQADKLRFDSWGTKILGTTIPHPIEMLKTPPNTDLRCSHCATGETSIGYLTVMIPKGLDKVAKEKGPYHPYLGSRTSETTSLIQPWERETKVPLIRRAAKLRKTISWFVDPSSKLAASILKNLESLTGEDWSGTLEGFKRTGSALHRFTSARQSNGGFTAISPAPMTWMICTTDTLSNLGDQNYDFMFQSLIIFALTTSCSGVGHKNQASNHHYHIGCVECIRVIDEPWLESDWELETPNVSSILKGWVPERTCNWGESNVKITTSKGNWDDVTNQDKSYHVGMMIGFIFSDMLMSHCRHLTDSSLFPLGIANKLEAKDFLEGLSRGIRRSCSLQLIHRRNLIVGTKPLLTLWGSIYYNIERLSESSNFLAMIRSGTLLPEIMRAPHKIPSSYPLNNNDVGGIVRSYLKQMLTQTDMNHRVNRSRQVWVFADVQSHDIIGSICLALHCEYAIDHMKNEADMKNKVRVLQEAYINMKNGNWPDHLLKEINQTVQVCESEIRHAVKGFVKPEEVLPRFEWGDEYTPGIKKIDVKYDNIKRENYYAQVPRRQFPGMAGLRTFQLATGAHYKLRGILKNMKINWCEALVGGDGSGGISALLCRMNPLCRIVFNSLLMMEGIDFKGSHPSPPSALTEIGDYRRCCINYYDVWKYSSDLSKVDTWDYFTKLQNIKHWNPDLMIFDMEVSDEVIMSRIEKLVSTRGLDMLKKGGTIIFKTYISRILEKDTCILDLMGWQFGSVSLVQTDVSSSFTSEVYVVFQSYSPNGNIKLHPDKEDICFNKDHFLFNRNFKEETERCHQISMKDLMIGVPAEMRSDLTTDWNTLLVSIGVRSGYAVSMSKTWVRYIEGQGFSYLVGNLIVAFEDMLPTWSVSQPVPSNGTLENLWSFWLGIVIWIGIRLNNPKLIGRSYNMIESGVTFWFNNDNKTNKRSWKINTTEKYDSKKKIFLNKKMALVGQTIRVCQRMFGHRGAELNPKIVDSFTRFYNKGISIKNEIRNTDILIFLEEIQP